MVDVLIGTFLGDTAAYFGGRLYGRRPLAPLISPNKTLEGLVAGVLGGTLAFWCAGLYQDWLSGADALVIGLAVALAAPVGDLFESLVKRDLAVKDTGSFFGAHGGVLDRLDAVFFTMVAAYYAAQALATPTVLTAHALLRETARVPSRRRSRHGGRRARVRSACAGSPPPPTLTGERFDSFGRPRARPVPMSLDCAHNPDGTANVSVVRSPRRRVAGAAVDGG